MAEGNGRFQRILVLLDASVESGLALEAAAELAARHGRELHGLYVQDADVLRAASFPFARAVTTTTARVTPLEPRAVRERLSGRGREIRRAMELVAGHRALRWSLETAQGRVEEEIRRRIMPSDLLVLGKIGWSTVGGRRMGSVARRLMQEHESTVVLYGRPRTATGEGVAVLLNERGAQTANAAAWLARNAHEPLLVLAPPGTAAALQGVRTMAEQQELPIRIRRLPDNTARAVSYALSRERPRIFVVERTHPLLQGQAGQRFMEGLGTAIAVVS